MSILGGIFMQVHTLHHNKQKLLFPTVCDRAIPFSALAPNFPACLQNTHIDTNILAEFVPTKSSHASANVNHYISLEIYTYNYIFFINVSCTSFAVDLSSSPRICNYIFYCLQEQFSKVSLWTMSTKYICLLVQRDTSVERHEQMLADIYI